jgi:alkyl sulfatase BDS1-like metallo-beta-lactamase superfamily hydrolase
VITDWHISDENRIHRLELRNGLLTHYDLPSGVTLPDPDASFTLTRPTLIRVLLAGADFGAAVAGGDISVGGDPTKLAEIVGAFDEPDPDFAIVTP